VKRKRFLFEVWNRECFIEVYINNQCKIIIVWNVKWIQPHKYWPAYAQFTHAFERGFTVSGKHSDGSTGMRRPHQESGTRERKSGRPSDAAQRGIKVGFVHTCDFAVRFARFNCYVVKSSLAVQVVYFKSYRICPHYSTAVSNSNVTSSSIEI